MKHLSENEINEYLDQALSQKEHDATQAHLDACSACRACLEDLQVVFRALETLPDVQPPAQLLPATLLRLPNRKRVDGWRMVFAVQFALALILLATLLPGLKSTITQSTAAWEAWWAQSGFALPKPAQFSLPSPETLFARLPEIPFQTLFQLPQNTGHLSPLALIEQAPSLPLPDFSHTSLSIGAAVFLLVSVTVAGMAGNYALLHHPHKAKK